MLCSTNTLLAKLREGPEHKAKQNQRDINANSELRTLSRQPGVVVAMFTKYYMVAMTTT